MTRRRRTDQLALFDEPRCKRCTEPCVAPVCWACIESLRAMSAFGEEWWGPVAGREGYLVSNLGRVRSLDRVVVQRHGGGGTYLRRMKGQVLAQHLGSHGYPSVGIPPWPRMRVHTLMGLAFFGPPSPNMEICHFNDVPGDNRLFNIRYDSHSANMRDLVRNGNNRNASKTHCPRGHPYAGDNLILQQGGHRRCRTCDRARTRERMRAKYRADPEAARAHNREWREKNPDYFRAYREAKKR